MQNITVSLEEKLAALRSNGYFSTLSDKVLESLAQGQEMPLTGLTDAARTHEVIFAADLSWQERRPVKLEEVSHAV